MDSLQLTATISPFKKAYSQELIILLSVLLCLMVSSCKDNDRTVNLALGASNNSGMPYLIKMINPPAESIRDIRLSRDGKEGWAIGDYGMLIHYTDSHWKLEDRLPDNQEVDCFWMNSDCTEGWAVNGNHNETCIYQYQNKKWKAYPKKFPPGYFEKIIMTADGKQGWLIGKKMGILSISSGDTGASLGSLHEATLMRFSGGTWSDESDQIDNSVNDLWLSPGGEEAWALGDNSAIYHFKDQRWTETEKQIPYSSNLKFLWVNDSGNAGWAAGGSDNPFMQFKDGKWNKLPKDTAKSEINQFWMSHDGTKGWAIDAFGRIFRLSNGDWKLDYQYTGKEIFYSLQMRDGGSEGWAVGSSGLILHYDKARWFPEATDLTYQYLNKLAINPGGEDAWATGTRSTLFHYRQGAWKEDTIVLTNSELDRIAVSKNNTGWATGADGTILKLDGQTWKRVSSGGSTDTLTMLQLNNPQNNGFALNHNGAILYYNGTAWKQDSKQILSNRITAFSMDRSGKKEGWALTDSNEIIHYLNGKWNLNWKQPRTADPYRSREAVRLFNIEMNADGTEGWAIGSVGQYNGLIMHYTNGRWDTDFRWTGPNDGQVYKYGAFFFLDLWMNREFTEGWAAGNRGTLFHYLKATGWKQEQLPRNPLNLLELVKMNDNGTEGWVSGQGILLHYIDGGWKRDEANLGYEMLANIWAGPKKNEAFGSYGDSKKGDFTILHYQLDHWETFYSSRTEEINDLAFAPGDLIYGVGTRGMLIRFEPLRKDSIDLPNSAAEALAGLKGMVKVSFKRKIKSIESVLLSGPHFEGFNLIRNKHYTMQLDSNGKDLTISFKNTAEILAKYAHESYHLGFRFIYASPMTEETVTMETIKTFQLAGPSPLVIGLWILLGMVTLNVLLVLAATRNRAVRWLVLHPIGSRVIGLFFGKYLITDILLHFVPFIRSAMFMDYRKGMKTAPFIRLWNTDKKYISPQVDISGFPDPGPGEDKWVFLIEQILKGPRDIVWTLVGRSGLGKTALLEQWTRIILEKKGTPLLIRLGTDDSVIGISLTPVQQYGELILSEEDLLDIIRWGGFVILLDGINEDPHADQTIKFIKLVVKRNVVIISGQDRHRGLNELNTRDVRLEFFGETQLVSLIGAAWTSAVMAVPYLAEIIKLPQTALLLSRYIGRNNRLPSFNLDIYADLVNIQDYDPFELTGSLTFKAWDLFAKQELTFEPDNAIPVNLCEAMTTSGVLTKTAGKYRFRHERIHRYFVAVYMFKTDDLDLFNWRAGTSRAQGQADWADIIEFLGEMFILEITNSMGQQRSDAQSQYQRFIVHTRAFNASVFRNRIYPQFIYYLSNNMIGRDADFLLQVSRLMSGSTGTL